MCFAVAAVLCCGLRAVLFLPCFAVLPVLRGVGGCLAQSGLRSGLVHSAFAQQGEPLAQHERLLLLWQLAESKLLTALHPLLCRWMTAGRRWRTRLASCWQTLRRRRRRWRRQVSGFER